jgi:WD40 repeat protein
MTWMTFVAAKPGGDFLVAATDAGWVGVWMPADNRIVHVQQTGGFVNRVGWTSDGNHLLATTNQDSLLVFSGDGARLESTIETKHGGLKTFGVHPSQPMVATIGDDGVARVWDVKSGALRHEVGSSQYGGTAVGLTETAVVCGYGSGWFKAWSYSGENQAEGELFAGSVASVGVAPDSKSVVFGGSRGKLVQAEDSGGDWRAGTVWKSHPPKGISTNTIEFAADGKFVAAHSDNTATVFSSTKEIAGRGLGTAFWLDRKTPWAQKFIVSSACFVPGTPIVATSHFTGELKLWSGYSDVSVRFDGDVPRWHDGDDSKAIDDPVARWNELLAKK